MPGSMRRNRKRMRSKSYSKKRLTSKFSTGSSPELKQLDTAYIAQPALSTAGSIANANVLNLIQVGSSAWNRIGRKIRMLSLECKGRYVNVSADANAGLFRFLVVYDAQPNGAAPPVSSILAERPQGGTQVTSDYSGMNLDNRNRFVILMDQYVTIGPTLTGNGATGIQQRSVPNTHLINRYIRLGGLNATYQASTNPSVIGDISTGALYFFHLVDGVDANMQFDGTWRLRFTDA